MQATRGQDRQGPETANQPEAMQAKPVGRSTQVDALGQGAPAGAGAKPPLFAGPAAWEDVHDDGAQLAALEAAPAHAEPAAAAHPTAHAAIAPSEPSEIAADEAAARPPAHDDAAPATDTKAAVQRKATASKAKPKPKHKPEKIYADTSPYNPRIHANHRGDAATQYARPGVRLGGKTRGHDKFTLSTNPAKRYRIASGNQAALVDQLDAATQKVAVNPPHSRNLILIDSVSGTPAAGAALPPAVPCVLTWESQQGPAWTPVSSLTEGTQIRAAADKLSKTDMPAAAPTSTKLVPYKFRDEPAATVGKSHPTTKEATQHIAPRQGTGANMLDHYLERDNVKTQLAPDAAGNDQSKRRYYGINLSVPQSTAPPVADDTAQPGDTFFVAQGKEFQARVAIFDPKTGDSKQARAHDAVPVVHQVWVYGFAAKLENGVPVADRSRRGWVPLRDLIK